MDQSPEKKLRAMCENYLAPRGLDECSERQSEYIKMVNSLDNHINLHRSSSFFLLSLLHHNTFNQSNSRSKTFVTFLSKTPIRSYFQSIHWSLSIIHPSNIQNENLIHLPPRHHWSFRNFTRCPSNRWSRDSCPCKRNRYHEQLLLPSPNPHRNH